MNQMIHLGEHCEHCRTEREARGRRLSLVSVIFRSGWVMELSTKARANFMTATQRFLIIMNSPLNVLLIHTGWWMNPWNRKFPARSMGVATYQRRWMQLVIRNYRIKGKMGPFAWALFESQITNEDPSCVLSNVLFILGIASFTNTLAGPVKEHNNSMKVLAYAWESTTLGVLEWKSYMGS